MRPSNANIAAVCLMAHKPKALIRPAFEDHLFLRWVCLELSLPLPVASVGVQGLCLGVLWLWSSASFCSFLGLV